MPRHNLRQRCDVGHLLNVSASRKTRPVKIRGSFEPFPRHYAFLVELLCGRTGEPRDGRRESVPKRDRSRAEEGWRETSTVGGMEIVTRFFVTFFSSRGRLYPRNEPNFQLSSLFFLFIDLNDQTGLASSNPPISLAARFRDTKRYDEPRGRVTVFHRRRRALLSRAILVAVKKGDERFVLVVW